MDPGIHQHTSHADCCMLCLHCNGFKIHGSFLPGISRVVSDHHRIEYPSGPMDRYSSCKQVVWYSTVLLKKNRTVPAISWPLSNIPANSTVSDKEKNK